MRIVVDTNVLVSAFVSATSSPARILDLWRAGDLEIVTSQAALDELQRVLLYPRIRTRLRYSNDQIDQFVALLRKHAL
ncbi:MAG: putative toxin-antitoxin system toxin component, PIN family, partial [Caldilineaceae bacterium]|nr:putative toxin-antitoxin system toxin component, PIN family [Caldilineaceae bacterium]